MSKYQTSQNPPRETSTRVLKRLGFVPKLQSSASKPTSQLALAQHSLHLSSALLVRQKNNHNFFLRGSTATTKHDQRKRLKSIDGAYVVRLRGDEVSLFSSPKQQVFFFFLLRSQRLFLLLAARWLNHCNLAKLPRVQQLFNVLEQKDAARMRSPCGLGQPGPLPTEA